MSKSKLTLIIDGNWLLMSRLSVLKNKYADDTTLNHQLKLLMIKSINRVLRTFNEIDNIIFVADGGSWRNSVEIPYQAILPAQKLLEFLPENKRDVNNIKEINVKDIVNKLETNNEIHSFEYKGTRTKAEDFNWDKLFESYEEFMTLLQSTGITCCRENGMEGDDWCYHWSRYLNEQGTNVIIWTKDKDLTQLVKMNNDRYFTIWWNEDSGIISCEMPEEDLSFLFNAQFIANDTLFQSLIDKAGKITTINPKEIVIDKILRGDSSDNIQPIVLRFSKNNSGKQFRISQNDINFNLDYNDDKCVYNYLYELLNGKNYYNRINKTIEQAFEHFKYNRKLIALDEHQYPENIKKIMSEHVDYNVNKDCTVAESQIRAQSNELSGILDLI